MVCQLGRMYEHNWLTTRNNIVPTSTKMTFDAIHQGCLRAWNRKMDTVSLRKGNQGRIVIGLDIVDVRDIIRDARCTTIAWNNMYLLYHGRLAQLPC